jgi:small-conductance mechanosensitive channel
MSRNTDSFDDLVAEAAKAIATLRAENAALRQALEFAKQTADAEFFAKLRAHDMTRGADDLVDELRAENARLREALKGEK